MNENKIGHEKKSCTSSLGFIKEKNPEDKPILDSPGYKDSRGLVIDINNMISIPA